MDDYNRYVTAVNKIYDYLEKMKAGWNNMDNKNYIDNIDDYKSIVTARAEEFKKPRTVQPEPEGETLEEEDEMPVDPHRQNAPGSAVDTSGLDFSGPTSTVYAGNQNLDVPGLTQAFVPSDVPATIPIAAGGGLVE